MVAEVVAVTEFVLIVKDALDAPAEMVTEPGTVAAELLLDRVTTAPPLGAGPLSVTVPDEEPPAVTLEGLSVREPSVTELTASCAVSEIPFKDAVIVTLGELPAELVVMVNVALVEPAGIVTEAGTLAVDESLLDNATRAPPLGAGPFNVTVPVAVPPADTLIGSTLNAESARFRLKKTF